MKRYLTLVCACFVLSVRAPATDYGPANGKLLLLGGMAGSVGITETFVNLAGGRDAKIIVVPTGGGVTDAAGKPVIYKEETVLASWKKLGLTNVHMLHAADAKEADTEECAQPLLDAKGVWFVGGRSQIIYSVYANTRTLAAFRQLLERGGVIAGSSAGAMIQAEYMGVRSETVPGAAPDPTHGAGFAFLRKTAIDVHVNARKSWDDLVPVVQKYPELLGLGISEGTAIVVTGDRFQVIGNWKVAVHDNTRVYEPWVKPYYILSPGDVYNMQTRRIEAYGTGALRPATIKSK